jgi:hypothetical protein
MVEAAGVEPAIYPINNGLQACLGKKREFSHFFPSPKIA